MNQQSFGPVIIQVPAKITEQFKKEAKKSFPNETMAYLLGHNEGKIIIDDLFFPPNVDAFCCPDEIKIQDAWITLAKKYAKSIHAIVVGDIHSHPHSKKQAKSYNVDIAPSEEDWAALTDGQIMAICLVTETKAGRLRARTKFWGPMLQVKVKQTK